MTEFYSPGQLSVLYPFLGDFVPKWFLLGGPADANEAQTAYDKWKCKIIAVEPNPAAIEFQKANCPCWSNINNHLVYGGLDAKTGTGKVRHVTGSARNSSMHGTEGSKEGVLEIPTYTWDSLDTQWGPVHDAILWMDIETWEYPALIGAMGLLERNSIKIVNVEMNRSLARERNEGIDDLLHRHNFKIVGEHNGSRDCWDRIYWRMEG